MVRPHLWTALKNRDPSLFYLRTAKNLDRPVRLSAGCDCAAGQQRLAQNVNFAPNSRSLYPYLMFAMPKFGTLNSLGVSG